MSLKRAARAEAAYSQGDCRVTIMDGERVRLYWPAGLLAVEGEGDVRLNDPDWALVYEAGRDDFVKRARIARRLSHPNLAAASVHIEDELAGTRIAAGGASLADRLDADAACPSEAILAMAHDLCEGLQALHEAGLLHLGLRPEVVVLEDGRAVIHDLSSDLRPIARLRGMNADLFDPFWFAPEARDAEGEQPLDVRVDVYGLSAILFRMITGDVPSPDRTVLAGHERAKACPAGLVAAIDAGLQPDPERRPADITAWREVAGLADAGRVNPRDRFDLLNGPAPVMPGGVQQAADKAEPEVAPMIAPARRRRKPTAITVAVAALGLAVLGAGGAAAYLSYKDGRWPEKLSTLVPGAEPTPLPLPEAPQRCSWSHGDVVNDDVHHLSCTADARPGMPEPMAPMTLRLNDVHDARAGNAEAMVRLGLFYLRKGPAHDPDKAVEWLGRASELQNAEARLAYAAHLENPRQTYSGSGPLIPAERRMEDGWEAAAGAAEAAAEAAAEPGPAVYVEPESGEVERLEQAHGLYAAVTADPNASSEQKRRADEGASRTDRRLLRIRNGRWEGCWVQGNTMLEFSISGRVLTARVPGQGWQAQFDIAQPRRDDRLDVTPRDAPSERWSLRPASGGLDEYDLNSGERIGRYTRCVH